MPLQILCFHLVSLYNWTFSSQMSLKISKCNAVGEEKNIYLSLYLLNIMPFTSQKSF